MKRSTLFAFGFGAVLAPAAGGPIATFATEYSTTRELTVAMTTSVSMETTRNVFEVDGEPVEGRGGFGGGGSSEERKTVIKDHVLAADGGVPTKVRRTYDTVEGSMTFNIRDEDRELDLESAFNGIVLDLTSEDGTVHAEAVEGDLPDSEHLEGMRLTQPFDALLPDGDVSKGDTWKLDKDALIQALMLDRAGHLFQPPQFGEGEGGGGGRGGGGGGGGRRGGGGFGGGPGRGNFGLLASADLSGEAELASMEDVDGGTVAHINFKAEASGEVEGGGGFGGGGGGGRGGEGGGGSGETTYTVELEGELVFSITERRPVSLSVKGEMTRSSDRTFDRGDRSMHTVREESGKFEMDVEIASNPVEKDE